MKRISKLVIAWGALALLVTGGVALARNAGFGHHGDFLKHKITAHVDEALELVKATPAQRTVIYGARDRVLATLEAQHRDRRPDFQRVLTLFEAERIDQAQVQSLRAEHEAAMKAGGDAIVQALKDAHDALTPAQRRTIVDWARAHKEDGPPKMARDFMKHRANAKLDEALAAVQATDVQKVAIHAAAEHLIATFEDGQDHTAQKERALALFAADQLDGAAVDALRAEHVARAQKIGDAVVQAVSDAHDALTAPQRQKLVEWVKAQHAQHEHHGG